MKIHTKIAAYEINPTLVMKITLANWNYYFSLPENNYTLVSSETYSTIKSFEMASNPPLEYANCKCSRVRPEADTFSAIDFFKQISGWRVLKASFF